MTHIETWKHLTAIIFTFIVSACGHREIFLSLCPSSGEDPFSKPTDCDCAPSFTILVPTHSRPSKKHTRRPRIHGAPDIDVAPLGRWIELSIYTSHPGLIAALAHISCPAETQPVILIPRNSATRESHRRYQHDFLMLLPRPQNIKDTSIPVCRLSVLWQRRTGSPIHRRSIQIYAINRIVSDELLSPSGYWDHVPPEAIPERYLEPPPPPAPPRYCPNWRSPAPD